MSAPEKIWLQSPDGVAAVCVYLGHDVKVLERRGWKRVEVRAPEEPKKERYMVRDSGATWQVWKGDSYLAAFDYALPHAEADAREFCKKCNEREAK